MKLLYLEYANCQRVLPNNARGEHEEPQYENTPTLLHCQGVQLFSPNRSNGLPSPKAPLCPHFSPRPEDVRIFFSFSNTVKSE